MRPASTPTLLLLVFTAILSAACIGVSDFEADPSPTPLPPDRADCGEVLGTAFRSRAERDWFVENCSAWSRATLGVVEAAPPAAQVAPTTAPAAPIPAPAAPIPAPAAPVQAAQAPLPGEDPRCAQMRGQPYGSVTDRAWFLANCLGGATTTQPAFDTGPDRFNCDEIRGTNYRSGNERNWFLQNCLVTP